MTEQEIINTEFQRNIDKSNMRVDTIEVKIDAFIRSLEDFKTEMRDRDNQRAAETAALRVEMAETTKKMSEEISGIKTELKEFDKYFHNLALAAIVGVSAAVVGIGVMVVGLLIK